MGHQGGDILHPLFVISHHDTNTNRNTDTSTDTDTKNQNNYANKLHPSTGWATKGGISYTLFLSFHILVQIQTRIQIQIQICSDTKKNHQSTGLSVWATKGDILSLFFISQIKDTSTKNTKTNAKKCK